MAYATIDNPELFFQTKLYSGTGSALSITLDGSENMQPDWVWIKERNASASSHNLTDSVEVLVKVYLVMIQVKNMIMELEVVVQ